MEVTGVKSLRSMYVSPQASAGKSAPVKSTPPGLMPEDQEPQSGSVSVVEKESHSQPVKQKTLRDIAREVREHLKKVGIKIQFEINKEAGKIVVIVKDPETDKVVREIPPDVYLKMVEYLKRMQEQDEFQGIEVDVKY